MRYDFPTARHVIQALPLVDKTSLVVLQFRPLVFEMFFLQTRKTLKTCFIQYVSNRLSSTENYLFMRIKTGWVLYNTKR